MESKIFFILNPFLHILGQAAKNLCFDITGIFIAYCSENGYPVIEKIGEGNQLLSCKVHRELLSKEKTCLCSSWVTVSSKNGEVFNKTISSLLLVFFYLYKEKRLTIQKFANQDFWVEVDKFAKENKIFESDLSKKLFMEMSRVRKKEPVLAPLDF